MSGVLASDADNSVFNIQENVERPRFNVAYSNKFAKLNSRLKRFELRVGKLIKVVVYK